MFFQWNEGSMGIRGLDLAGGQQWKKGKNGRRQNSVEKRMKVEYGRDSLVGGLPTPVTMISF